VTEFVYCVRMHLIYHSLSLSVNCQQVVNEPAEYSMRCPKYNEPDPTKQNVTKIIQEGALVRFMML